MSFENFPYTNFHEINLDWIIQKVKEAYSPDNPPESLVLSVNGQTGDVVLYTDAFITLPSIESPNWNIHRLNNGVSEGIEFDANGAKRIKGQKRFLIYDSQNPPPYPVISVNGKTGAVNIDVPTIPVTSVNNKTGDVVTPFRNPNGEILQLDTNSPGNYWGLSRIVSGGSASIYLDTTGGTVKAYISFTPTGGGNTVTLPLLSNADIPSGAGVISVNGKTGAVTINAGNITNPGTGNTVQQDITTLRQGMAGLSGTVGGFDTRLSQEETARETADRNLNTAIGNEASSRIAADNNIEKAIAHIIDGNTAPANIPENEFVYVRNSNIPGVGDGLYLTNQAIPVNTTVTSTMLRATESGGLNIVRDTFLHKEMIAGTDFTYTTGANCRLRSVPTLHKVADSLYALHFVYEILSNIAPWQSLQLFTLSIPGKSVWTSFTNTTQIFPQNGSVRNNITRINTNGVVDISNPYTDVTFSNSWYGSGTILFVAI